jgi:hypothetical protein
MNDFCNWRKIEKNYSIAKRATIRQGKLIWSTTEDLYKRNVLKEKCLFHGDKRKCIIVA